MAEEWLASFAAQVATCLEAGTVQDKASLHKAKQRIARGLGATRMPQDPELLPFLSEEQVRRFSPLLRKKPMRSQSGVAIVAVMSSPAGCPHGKCIYCPGGPEVDAPQSYTGFEPSTMRAKSFQYDPYRVVRHRLATLERNGHGIDKLEIVVQGGTFPARDPAYQDWFIHQIYQAANDGPLDDPPAGQAEATWQAMDEGDRSDHLVAVQRANESADCRIIGLTVETKPDWCFEEHVDGMLRHGATRIELGIQTLDEATTALTNRGHTVADSAKAMQVARDAGFKVCVHLMPGLPRPKGAAPDEDDRAHPVSRQMDIEDARRLFEEPEWRPDMLKIYPTLVVMEGETTLKKWWNQGTFVPLDTEHATDVVAETLRHVPEYCRIQRIDRDIPTTHVEAGVMNSNLRQLAEAEADKRGIRLREIRAREVGTRIRQGVDLDPARVELVRREYEASSGTEVFLSFEDPVADALVAFIRLRRVTTSHRQEFQHEDGVAVVRELKVYGVAQGLGDHDDPETGAWQHQGFGARLLAAAEAIAFEEWQVGRTLVIAGAGVKAYYRKHGFADLGPYVAKDRACTPSLDSSPPSSSSPGSSS